MRKLLILIILCLPVVVWAQDMRKTPPVAIQLLEAAKIKSGSAEPNRKKVAEITWEQP